MKSAKKQECFIFINIFPASSGVGQMHPLTPLSYSLCYIPILISAEHYIPSHLYIFKFSSPYKLSKKTCEVYSEISVFWNLKRKPEKEIYSMKEHYTASISMQLIETESGQ